MTREEKIQELLEILNLSEEEQRKRIAIYLDPPPWKHHFVAGFLPHDPERCNKCGKKLRTKKDYDEECPYTYSYTGSLADLAFKLRNETYLPDWSKALLLVYKNERQRDIKKYDEGCPFDCKSWSLNFANPVHWDIAGLIAKVLNEKE